MYPSILRHQAIFLTGAVLLFGILMASQFISIPYVNAGGFLIVFGGTYLSGLISFGARDLHAALEASFLLKPYPRFLLVERIKTFTEMSKTVRAEGPVALESLAKSEEAPILKKGLQLIADGVPYSELKHTVALEYSLGRQSRRRPIDALLQLASVAPAAGLIGTVIGLVSMLAGVDNAEDLSSGMSVALLTTLYGAILAYLVLQPLATRLEETINSREKFFLLQIEGVLALAQEINPQLVQERLEAFAA